MNRTPLDLRGKSMTELMEMDREIGDSLPEVFSGGGAINPIRDARVAELLADRRQIREEMEGRRDALGNLSQIGLL
jgi:hypothetical protein